MNSPPSARGSEGVGFTQPRAHSLAEPCTCFVAMSNHLFSDTRHHGLSVSPSLSLAAMREPKEDEARLLQLGSEEERPPPPPPPPLPWLFFLEMVMG